VAAIDELADRVHARAVEAGEAPKSPDDSDGPQYPPMENYAPPPFDLPPPVDDDEAGVEGLLPRDEEMEDEEERKRKVPPSSRGRGGAKRGRGRGRGRA
jgi:hypothetical protein